MNNIQIFECYLMSHMRGSKIVDQMCRTMGISQTAMQKAAEEIEASIGFLNMTLHKIDKYIPFLGSPIEIIPEPDIHYQKADGRSIRYRFHLPFFKGLDLILRTDITNCVYSPEFIRQPGFKVPVIQQITDLQPWSVVETEVKTLFNNIESEVAWNFGKDIFYKTQSPQPKSQIVLSFDFSLLQSVTLI